MLGKLLKYDLSALSRVLIPLHLVVLAVGCLACGAGFMGFASSEMGGIAPASAGDLFSLVSSLAALGMLLCIFLLFSATVATFVIVLNRFYRNLFTDEGYLTLTLPATAVQQIASKVFAGIIWMLIDALVVFACLLAINAAAEGFSLGWDATDSIPVWILGLTSGDLPPFSQDPFGWATIAGWVFRTTIQMLFMLLMAYASLTLGAAVAARHKIACGIGLFVGIWFGYGLFSGFVSIVVGFTLSFNTELALSTLSLLGLCLQVPMIAIFWALCAWLLNRKVNLP